MGSACGSSNKEGTEGEACYANGTCNAGLTCLSNTCVDADGGDGDGDGSGGDSNVPSVDWDACFGCGDAACPTERETCDSTPGCPQLLECTLSCGNDVTCSGGCSVEGLTPQELAAAGSAVTSYTTCSVTSCLDECTPQVDTGSGGSNSGGSDSSSGGNDDGSGGKSSGGNSSGGRSSGGNSSGGAPNQDGVQIFDGTGVGVGSEEFAIDGGFYILEDSVTDGALIAEPEGHTDLDPLDSTDEPSTLELSSYPCVSGTLAQVVDADGLICETDTDACEWESYWGGGLALTLDSTTESWDADAVGVDGFQFSLSGSIDGAPLRFVVEDTDGEQFCVDGVRVGSSVRVDFSDLEHQCWQPTSMNLDPSKIRSIAWQLVPNASQSFAIEQLCVDNLFVLN